MLGLDLLQGIHPSHRQRSADVEVGRGEGFFQVDRLLVLRDGLLPVALQQVDVAEVVADGGQAGGAGAALHFQRLHVELLRGDEVAVALGLARERERDGKLVHRFQPLLQSGDLQPRSFAVLDQPDVGGWSGEGGHLADPLRRPGRECEADQQGDGDDGLRRGGIERTREKRREDQRERAHLQQDG